MRNHRTIIENVGSVISLAGEDPVLTGQYGSHYTQGMQQWKPGTNGQSYLKMLSYLKHYTAYSVETDRFEF